MKGKHRMHTRWLTVVLKGVNMMDKKATLIRTLVAKLHQSGTSKGESPACQGCTT